MKNDLLTSDVIPEKELRAAVDAVSNCSSHFVELTRTLGLDKKNDFRHSNLRQVDFSYSDIRGFDFSGADLRFAHGVDVTLDETTILTGADMSGSFLAKLARERDTMANVPKANRFYEMLRHSDTAVVSKWLEARYLEGQDTHKVFREMTPEVASTLCQRLLTDDIELSKRMTMFYFLKKFAGTIDELREIVLEILALHIEKESVIRSFIKVSGELLITDPIVSKSVLGLCLDKRENIREAAFTALAESKFFQRNIDELESTFFSDANSHLRKKLLRSAAFKLGLNHILSINYFGKGRELEIEEVTDYSELLIPECIEQVVKSQRHRREYPSVRRVMELQQEVILTTPVISSFFKERNKSLAEATLQRIAKGLSAQARVDQNRVRFGYKRSNR